MSSNENLHKANINKNDEFYTQLEDIEKEVYKYKDQLEGKTIYCNCDDPAWSNFVRHFIMQFNYYKLKGLIATGYIKGAGALSVDLFTTGGTLKTSYCLKINKVDKELEQYIIDNSNKSMSNTELFNLLKQKGFITELEGDGDFRSQECIWLLHQSDIVITNPPFSLFREYISQLMSFDKKFLIMGNMNAVTYKDVFKHIKENKLWLGYNNNKTCEFGLSKYYEKYTRIENGMKFGKVPSISWFTNLKTNKQLEKLILYKKYYKTEEDKNNPNYINPEYPKYDNYNAIEVSRVADIPIDYDGVMGVPITFLDKYNPWQFELIGSSESGGNTLQKVKEIWIPKNRNGNTSGFINGRAIFKRLFIKKINNN